MVFKKWCSVALAGILAVSMILTGFDAKAVFAAGQPIQPVQPGSTVAVGTTKTPKYVFYFIGDGMGMAQINSAQIYLDATTDHTKTMQPLSFTKFPVQGMKTTYAADSFIPDSASAGTAMATGHKTNDGVIAMDTTKKIKYKSLAALAKEKGMKVGIVTSVSIDHATPAVFYAHQPSRSSYYDIGLELANSKFDYFAGGGFVQPKGKKGDQLDLYTIAKEKGYTVVNETSAFKALKNSTNQKVLAVNAVLDSSAALNYELNREASDLSLSDYTKKGIELLDNPNGFFMMVEGGKIDWACHANDAAASIHDTLAFSKSVNEAYAFYKKHPNETLIVVTGDHETGGMTIGYAGTKYETFYDKLSNQKIAYDSLDRKITALKAKQSKLYLTDVLPLIKQYYGLEPLSSSDAKSLSEKAKAGDKAAADKLSFSLTDQDLKQLEKAVEMANLDKASRPTDSETYLLYGGYEPVSMAVTHLINQKSGVGFTTYSHTGTAIPLYAIGAGQEQFAGYYDDTDSFKKLSGLMGLKVQ